MDDELNGARSAVADVHFDDSGDQGGTYSQSSGLELDMGTLCMDPDSDETQPGSIDVHDLRKRSLQRCTLQFVEYMEPNNILDVFEEENIFGPVTRLIVRDIRELDTTSNKNRQIVSKIQTEPSTYCMFKEALARTGQTFLIDKLEEAECKVHDEMTGQRQLCSCRGCDDCEVLRQIRYTEDLLPNTSKIVKALQQDLVQLYLSRCARVPVYPLDPDIMERVDKLFVMPNMEQVETTGRKPQTASYSDRGEPQKQNLEGYRDIFYNGEQKCKNVYITGEAGVGKSALCESMVHTWCMAHSKRERSCDEQIMAKFTLLFYISLRNSTDETSVEQMIENQLEIKDVSELLEQERCLIILDGLDEWTAPETQQSSRFITKGLPRRKLKGNFTVLTTTRPWKLEVLRLKETEIDKQINIAGFSDRSIDTLVKRVTDILNEKYEEHKIPEDFDRIVEENKLHDLIQTPVLLMQMLCLWHGGNSIGHSQCDIYSNIIDRQLEYAEEMKDIRRQASGLGVNILPECLSEKTNCQKYGDLLLALSNLAFQLLCSKTKESSLVFSHKQTEIHGLTKENLEICLKVGLLTQHKVHGRITEKLKSVSFIHKTTQEFFAALYLATQPSASSVCQTMAEVIHDLDSFLEMAKLLLFLCGMRPEISGELFEQIMETVSADSRIQRYRTFWFDVESEALRLANRIQDVVLEILKEIGNSLVTPNLRLDDLIIRKGTFTDFLTSGKHLKSGSVKSIYFNSLTLKPQDIASVENPYEIYSSIFSSKSLVKLCVLDSSHCIYSPVLCSAVCNVSDNLKCIGLVAVDIEAMGRRIDDMLNTPFLVSLVLRDLTLTHEQIDLLANRLSLLTEIKQLNLSNLRCATHSKDMCRYTLDLSSMRYLEGLFLYELGVDDVYFDSKRLVECSIIAMPTTGFLKNLRDAKNLRKLICLGMYRQVNAEALTAVLPSLLNVKSMDIQTVDFGNTSLMLSSAMEHLELVSLSNVTISDWGLRQFVDSLPMNGVTVYLHLTVTPTEDAITTPDYIRQSPNFVVTKDFMIMKGTRLFMEFFTAGNSDSD